MSAPYLRKEVIGSCELYLGDCTDIIPTLGKVDACITDPPYHGVKADKWDNQWRTDADFLAWASIIRDLIFERTNSSASLYWFCSPQMAARLEEVIAGRFRVINSLIWDKSGSRNGVAGTGIDVTALRGYWTANTERIVFAERPDGDAAASSVAGYEASCVGAKAGIFGDYLRAEFKKAGAANREIAALFPSRSGGLTGCVSNWLLGLNVPTAEQYEIMRTFLNRDGAEYLKREYEDLKREYEDLRRPFNITALDTWGDVWRFAIERNQQHPTQKPLQMMRHIVKVSSRPTDLVLDPFAGSGTTGVACAKLGRSFVGIEKDERYFAIACERIRRAYAEPDMFVAAPAPQPEQLSILDGAA